MPPDPLPHSDASQKSPASEQIMSVQVLRGLAALAVVLLHIRVWEGKNVAHQVSPSWFTLGDAGVDVFFVISGFIMSWITPRPLETARAWRQFLWRRYTRIYPPYWVITGLLFMVWCLKPQYFNNYYGNQVDIWRSFLLLPQQFTPLLVVGWSLIHEVYFYLIVSLALCFRQRGRLTFGLCWAAVVTVGHGFVTDHTAPLGQLVFSPFSLTFLLGFFIGLRGRSVRPAVKVWPAWLLIFLGTLALVIGWQLSPGSGLYPLNNSYSRFVLFGIPAAVLLLGCLRAEPFLKLAKDSWLMALGNASYSLYLVHLPAINFFYKMGGGWLETKTPPVKWLAVMFCIALSLALGGAFHHLMEKPVLAWINRRRLLSNDLAPQLVRTR